MTLTAREFIRRFLQHVLPKGVHKVRYYGLWVPSNRRLLSRIQIVLGGDEPYSPSDGAKKGLTAYAGSLYPTRT